MLTLWMLLGACTKEVAPQQAEPVAPAGETSNPYIRFSIAKGAHYCDQSAIKPFAGSILRVNVKFDSSAVYSNQDPANQADINKLIGFTEGVNNHLNSARFGWGWSNNALRLYAYSYAAGVRSSKEISILRIGEPVSLSLSVDGNEYVFKADEKLVRLPRSLSTPAVEGYWQYPYFGGDEQAPHPINIYIQFL